MAEKSKTSDLVNKGKGQLYSVGEVCSMAGTTRKTLFYFLKTKKPAFLLAIRT